MLLKFIIFCLLFIVVGGGFIAYKQPSIRERFVPYVQKVPVPKEVKGISTSKAGKITNDLKSDLDDGVKQAQKQAMDLKVSDILNFINRGQKIAKDFRGFQDYIKEQVDNLIKKK